MGRISRNIKYILKSIIKHNPFDAYYNWNRARHLKRGDLDIWEHHLYWRFGKRLSTQICKLLNGITWNERSDLPKGPYVVVANHNRAVDPLYIGTTIWWKVAWLSKKKNFETPIMKTLIGQMGAIPLGIAYGDEPMMTEYTKSEIDRAVKRKHAIGIFPQGHRTKEGILPQFHTGAARLCLQYDMPYIPVSINGSRKPFKGKAWVTIGNPVYLGKVEMTYENLQQIAEDMRRQVQHLLDDKPLSQQPTAHFEGKQSGNKQPMKVSRRNGTDSEIPLLE